jgi:hypothetical protein
MECFIITILFCVAVFLLLACGISNEKEDDQKILKASAIAADEAAKAIEEITSSYAAIKEYKSDTLSKTKKK